MYNLCIVQSKNQAVNLIYVYLDSLQIWKPAKGWKQFLWQVMVEGRTNCFE